MEDWEAFRLAAEESRACIAELKELLQQDDPIGPDLEENFEEISKQRVSFVIDNVSSFCVESFLIFHLLV